MKRIFKALLSLAFLASIFTTTPGFGRELVYGDFDQTGQFLAFNGADGSKPFLMPGTAGNIYDWSAIGDSRTQDFYTGPNNGYKNSRSWLAWAMAYYKQSFRVVGMYGVSAKRTDEYLTNGNFEKAMVDGSGTMVFGFPVVNDLSQATGGYTDTYGRSVTASNVVDLAIGNLVTKIKAARQAGKRVIVLAEPGATTFTAAQVATVHEFNRKYRDQVRTIPGVYWWNFNRLIWNATSSSTLIAFKANYTGDGTHAQQAMGQALGKDFATNFLPTFFPSVDSAVDNTSELIANGVGQLFANPLFTTLTGGTTGSNITLTSGTVPGSVSISGSAAGALSVVITNASNAAGLGNDVTYAFTATSAVTGRIDFTIPNAANLALTDYVEAGVEYDLGAGCAANVYSEAQMNSDVGTFTGFDLYSAASGPPSGLADTGVVLRSTRATWLPNSTTIGYYLHRLNLNFTGAGTCTINTRRASIVRYR